MNTQTPVTPDLAAVKAKQQATWSSGNYALIGSTLQIVGEELCEAIDLKPGASVLDVAAGNGNATIAAARRFAEVTSTDYVQSLLDASKARADAQGMDNIMYQIADAEALPFAAGSFDLVLSLLDLHWVNDLPGALAQIRHVLRPDGLFLGALLGGETLSELRAVLLAAEAEVSGGASPRVAPKVDLRDAGALLQRAGFALPVADADTLTVSYPNALALMRELRGMGEGNAVAGRSRRFTRRAVLLRAAALYEERFADADGRVPATFQVLYLTGWAPHDSQPRPLHPGSAQASLARALDADRSEP